MSVMLATNLRIGQAHHWLGEDPRAMEYLRRNVELSSGELLSDRRYMAGLPFVLSRAWLAMCLAELGQFGEARALGQEALQIQTGMTYWLEQAEGEMVELRRCAVGDVDSRTGRARLHRRRACCSG